MVLTTTNQCSSVLGKAYNERQIVCGEVILEDANVERALINRFVKLQQSSFYRSWRRKYFREICVKNLIEFAAAKNPNIQGEMLQCWITVLEFFRMFSMLFNGPSS